MNPIVVFAPGARVSLWGGDNSRVPAIVHGVCIDGSSPHVTYRVAYWNGTGFVLEWVEEFMVAADDAQVQEIGFERGKHVIGQ